MSYFFDWSPAKLGNADTFNLNWNSTKSVFVDRNNVILDITGIIVQLQMACTKSTHWSLVIICMPTKEDKSGPIILHLDSLKFHSSKFILSLVERFLKEEWKYVKETCSLEDYHLHESVWKNLPRSIRKKSIEVPQQENDYDCGLFVLYYMKRFIEEAPERLYQKDISKFGKGWFQPEEASALRKELRALLLQLFDEAKYKKHMTEPATPDHPLEGGSTQPAMLEHPLEVSSSEPATAVPPQQQQSTP
ncbi:hypothetical protein GUJ93_ZPchr0012g22066 [Zizania palustris]|uniref:Ubiquitin-like protease family profile domain-containing protein n=1 Tax=Zizania palustris TaxID=103762 RepID=A0A8J5WN50_ZIZPA|nr:hypothetical protein GUJ93_ZPchr0012g22066 [Zizania palustris]